MSKYALFAKEATFVEMPNGIFTAAGVWFHATEEMIRSYAGEVLERVPLARLLHLAEVWLRSAETLALWALPIFLLLADPLPAGVAALLLFAGWKIFGPALVSLAGVRLVAVMDIVLVQALYYVFFLSMLMARGDYAEAGVALAGFVLLRWGLLAFALQPLVARAQAALYALPVPDQVLRAFIVRVAMKHRLSLPHLDRIEKQIMENWKRGTP